MRARFLCSEESWRLHHACCVSREVEIARSLTDCWYDALAWSWSKDGTACLIPHIDLLYSAAQLDPSSPPSASGGRKRCAVAWCYSFLDRFLAVPCVGPAATSPTMVTGVGGSAASGALLIGGVIWPDLSSGMSGAVGATTGVARSGALAIRPARRRGWPVGEGVATTTTGGPDAESGERAPGSPIDIDDSGGDGCRVGADAPFLPPPSRRVTTTRIFSGCPLRGTLGARSSCK